MVATKANEIATEAVSISREAGLAVLALDAWKVWIDGFGANRLTRAAIHEIPGQSDGS